ncbi:hypothetical protein [Streptomyces sp. AC555_RSS877]|uniref:hypothetical protein n=1 Tax=Streptomyces sp. AC555_RSS877 TaxID=2823688 RepID=UPI001C27B044|nr:hypothetical protein [Streptomyces sp. AC555_RSS877]
MLLLAGGRTVSVWGDGGGRQDLRGRGRGWALAHHLPLPVAGVVLVGAMVTVACHVSRQPPPQWSPSTGHPAV